MKYPKIRLKRWRTTAALRALVRETKLSPNNFVLPLFIRSGRGVKKNILSMPGHFQMSVDNAVKEVREAKRLGIGSVLLFGVPDSKDELGSEAFNPQGVIQVAVSEIKQRVPETVVITDLCFCEYTSHGHCGAVRKGGSEPNIDNDATLDLIAKTALVQAQAGADIIAPSGMVDGMVRTIRQSLDANGFTDRLILSYAAKYASSFYAPFREAAEGAPQFGDRRTYQMDSANGAEALREVSVDINEGADMVMVKPALSYLDIIYRVKRRFNIPVAAYNVSGEYAMVRAAGAQGWLDADKAALEILLSIKRAGADLIITYHAKDVAKQL